VVLEAGELARGGDRRRRDDLTDGAPGSWDGVDVEELEALDDPARLVGDRAAEQLEPRADRENGRRAGEGLPQPVAQQPAGRGGQRGVLAAPQQVDVGTPGGARR
jgi:hypothetical protein